MAWLTNEHCFHSPCRGWRAQDYLCFYCSSRSDASRVGEWHCFVDEDRATPQEGDFCESDDVAIAVVVCSGD